MRFARVFGIPLAVDLSWSVIAVLVTWILYAELWRSDRDAGVLAILGLAVAGAILFFGCLLVVTLPLALWLLYRHVASRYVITNQRTTRIGFGGRVENQLGACTLHADRIG